jgi:hypothetical protein
MTTEASSHDGAPSDEEAAAFDRLFPMLMAFVNEMSELSKKKPDGIVSPLKIRNINRLLTDLGKILDKDPSRAFVEMLDEETLPQNSDAVVLLSQWRAALSQYKALHHRKDPVTWEPRWYTATAARQR